MRKLFTSLTVAAAGLVGFAATALATGAIDPQPGNESLFDLAKPVLDAVMNGNGWLAAAGALVLLVAATMKYGAPRWPWLNSDFARSALVFVGAFGGAVSTALLALGGSGMSGALAFTALKIAITASGGYQGLKKLIVPALEWLKSKLPSWAAFPLSLLLAALNWALGSSSREAAAKKAGDDALKANPPGGIEAITGQPREVR